MFGMTMQIMGYPYFEGFWLLLCIWQSWGIHIECILPNIGYTQCLEYMIIKEVSIFKGMLPIIATPHVWYDYANHRVSIFWGSLTIFGYTPCLEYMIITGVSSPIPYPYQYQWFHTSAHTRTHVLLPIPITLAYNGPVPIILVPIPITIMIHTHWLQVWPIPIVPIPMTLISNGHMLDCQ